MAQAVNCVQTATSSTLLRTLSAAALQFSSYQNSEEYFGKKCLFLEEVHHRHRTRSRLTTRCGRMGLATSPILLEQRYDNRRYIAQFFLLWRTLFFRRHCFRCCCCCCCCGYHPDQKLTSRAPPPKPKALFVKNIRYTAYASDVGEGLRPVLPGWAVKSAYGFAGIYMVGDVVYETATVRSAGGFGATHCAGPT